MRIPRYNVKNMDQLKAVVNEHFGKDKINGDIMKIDKHDGQVYCDLCNCWHSPLAKVCPHDETDDGSEWTDNEDE